MGYYDGINIGEAQKSPEQKDTVESWVSFVEDMWEDQEERVKALEGLHTSQMVHLFRTENEKEEITDDRFWENRGEEDEYPFLFITMQRWNVKAEDLRNQLGEGHVCSYPVPGCEEETFADMMSILLLDLGVEEFFESFFSDSLRVTREYEPANTLHWRLALVTKVMCDNRKEPDGKWNEENLKGLEEAYQKNEPKKSRFIYAVRKLIENYLCDGENIFDIYDTCGGGNGPVRNLDRLYNPEIGKIFCRYLQCCYQKFDAKWKSGGYEEEGIEELRNVYTRLKSPDSIDNYIVIMRTEIEKFIQKHIIREPEEALESEAAICTI